MNYAAQMLIKLYQWTLSPFLGSACRFYPSCSHYSSECYQKYNFSRASKLTLKRLFKCHPFHPGGVDLP